MTTPQSLAVGPRQVRRSVRRWNERIKTSGYAGKILPLAAVPLHREDSFRGHWRFEVDMEELAMPLDNSVQARFYVHLVPNLAFDRFEGSMDALNKAYRGEGGVGFFHVAGTGANHRGSSVASVISTLGCHVPDGSFNLAYVAAYNHIVNARYASLSDKLQPVSETATNLSTCPWGHRPFRNIVPSFDQAMIDGEVPLTIVDSQLPVKGIGLTNYSGTIETGLPVTVKETGGEQAVYSTHTPTSWDADISVNMESGAPAVFAEMQDRGITVSLANIELAKKTAAWAKMRKRYSHLDDDGLIDMLMDGVRIPDLALTKPILLDYKSTIFGYNRRFSTDSDALNVSVTDGMAVVELNGYAPPVNTGGIVMVTCEIVPEQMFERQEDPFLTVSTVDDIPHALRDDGRPEKVDVVKNRRIDMNHSTPDAVFGYEPMNARWDREGVRIGGKFYKPEASEVFDEDRQSIWTVEAADPEFNEDFLLANDIHHDVFAYANDDPFIFRGRQVVQITGNTQFGTMLHEGSDDYDHIIEQVPVENIEQETEE